MSHDQRAVSELQSRMDGPSIEPARWLPVETTDHRIDAYPELAQARWAAGRASDTSGSEIITAAYTLDAPEPRAQGHRTPQPLPVVQPAATNSSHDAYRQDSDELDPPFWGEEGGPAAQSRQERSPRQKKLIRFGHWIGQRVVGLGAYVEGASNTEIAQRQQAYWDSREAARVETDNSTGFMNRSFRRLAGLAIGAQDGAGRRWDYFLHGPGEGRANGAWNFSTPAQVAETATRRRAPQGDEPHDNAGDTQQRVNSLRHIQRDPRVPFSTAKQRADGRRARRGGRTASDDPSDEQRRDARRDQEVERTARTNRSDEVQADPSVDFYINRARQLYMRDRNELGDVDPDTWVREQAHAMRTSDQNNSNRMIGRAIFEAQRADPGYQQQQAAQREAIDARNNDPHMIEARRLFERDFQDIPVDQREGWVEATAHGLRENARQEAARQAAEQRAQAEQRAKAEQAAVGRANRIADIFAVEFKRNADGVAMAANTGYKMGVEAYETADGLARQIRALYPEQWKARGLDNQSVRQQAVRATAATLVRMNLGKRDKRLIQAAFAREMLGMEIAAR